MTALIDRLADHAQAVETRLQTLLERAAPAEAAPERLAEAMRYAVLGGGKRLRPALTIECAALFGIPSAEAVNAACAIEFLHCYSLVHDDLPAMDDDKMRRGRPTVHLAFDEATAILTGDSLLTLAFELLADPQTHADPNVRALLVHRLAKAAGWCGMAGGQQLDLQAEGRVLELPVIARIQALKTGALITFSCEAGGLLARADDEQLAALARYGRAVGLAFQIADDLLDATGDVDQVGKAIGKDAAAGKASFVAVLGVETVRQRLNGLRNEAVEALEPFGERGETLAGMARFICDRDH